MKCSCNYIINHCLLRSYLILSEKCEYCNENLNYEDSEIRRKEQNIRFCSVYLEIMIPHTSEYEINIVRSILNDLMS